MSAPRSKTPRRRRTKRGVARTWSTSTTRRRADLVDEYHAAGLGAEAIVAPQERFEHPQLRATGSVVDVDDPEIGMTTQFGVPIFLTATPGAVRGPRPRPGAHTDDVLADVGRTADEIASLRAQGIV